LRKKFSDDYSLMGSAPPLDFDGVSVFECSVSSDTRDIYLCPGAREVLALRHIMHWVSDIGWSMQWSVRAA
jgi:hypothetical protein